MHVGAEAPHTELGEHCRVQVMHACPSFSHFTSFHHCPGPNMISLDGASRSKTQMEGVARLYIGNTGGESEEVMCKRRG